MLRGDLLEILLVFTVGAGLYGLIEILWRGYTHWSMLLCGGACFTLMYWVNLAALPLWAKCIICAVCISALEFCTGYLVNIILKWDVWDYSDRALNLLGQICPLYSLFWLLLSVPGLYLSRWLKSIFG